MRKRVLSFAICVILLVSCFETDALAAWVAEVSETPGVSIDEYTTENINYVAQNKEQNLYIVTNAAQFLQIANDPSGFYELQSDISLDGYDLSSLMAIDFSGIINGRGHTVSGINISSFRMYDDGSSCSALFATVSGMISNVSFSNATIDIAHRNNIASYVGIICGKMTSSASLNSVSVSGSITVSGGAGDGALHVDSFAGQNHGKIANCTSYIDVIVNISQGAMTSVYGIGCDNSSNCTYNGHIKVDTVTGCSVAGIMGGINNTTGGKVEVNLSSVPDLNAYEYVSVSTIAGSIASKSTMDLVVYLCNIEESVYIQNAANSSDTTVSGDTRVYLDGILAHVNIAQLIGGEKNRCTGSLIVSDTLNTLLTETMNVSLLQRESNSFSSGSLSATIQSVPESRVSISAIYESNYCTNSGKISAEYLASKETIYSKIYVSGNGERSLFCVNKGDIVLKGNYDGVVAGNDDSVKCENYGSVIGIGSIDRCYFYIVGNHGGEYCSNYGKVMDSTPGTLNSSNLTIGNWGTKYGYNYGNVNGRDYAYGVYYPLLPSFNYGNITSEYEAYGVCGDNSENHGSVTVESDSRAIATGAIGKNSLNTGTVTAIGFNAYAIGAYSNTAKRIPSLPDSWMVDDNEISTSTGVSVAITSSGGSATVLGKIAKIVKTDEWNDKRSYSYTVKDGNYLQIYDSFNWDSSCPVHTKHSYHYISYPVECTCIFYGVDNDGDGRIDPNKVAISDISYTYRAVKIPAYSGYGAPITINTSIGKVSDDTFTVTVLDRDTGEPLPNAYVTWGGASAYSLRATVGQGITGTNGRVTLPRPSNSTDLIILADGYVMMSIGDYSYHLDVLSDTFTLCPEQNFKIIPTSCNGKYIDTSYVQINNKIDSMANIFLSSTLPDGYEVLQYEIYQGDTTLANNKKGVFFIKNELFIEDTPVYARLTVYDVNNPQNTMSVKQQLNIIVVSFTFNPEFSFHGINITIPDNINVFGGVEFNVSAAKMGVKYSVTNDTFTLGLNLGNVTDASRLPQGLRNWHENQMHKVKTKDYTIDGAGYLVAKFGPEGVESITGEFKFKAGFRSGFGFNSIVFGFVPTRVEVEWGADGEVTITNFELNEDNGNFFMPNVGLSTTGTVLGRVGLGSHVMSLGVYGSMSLLADSTLFPEFQFESLTVEGTLGVYFKATNMGKIFEGINQDYPLITGRYILYDREQNLSYPANFLSGIDIGDTANFVVNDREYLNDRGAWDGYNWDDDALQTGVYSGLDPQIVMAGDTVLMFFLDDDGGDDNYNFQKLMVSEGYIAYNGDVVFYAPYPVDDAPVINGDFSVCSDGTDVWVLYTAASRSFTEADTVEDYATGMEIKVARYTYDWEDYCGYFTDFRTLTDDAFMDFCPDITVNNGILSAMWAKNYDNNILGLGKNSIYVSTYEDGVWNTKLISENLSLASQFEIGALNNKTTTAVILDEDNDFITPESKLGIVTEDSDIRILDSGLISSPVFFDNKLFWYSNGKIMRITSGDGVPEEICTLPENASGDFDIIAVKDDFVILFTVSYGESEYCGSRIWASVSGGVPVQITDNDGYIDSFSANWDGENSNINIVYRQTDVTFTEQGFGTTSNLYGESIFLCPNLEVLNATADYDDLINESNVEIKFNVQNTGLAPISKLVFTIGTEFVWEEELVLVSGESKEVVISYPMPVDEPDDNLVIQCMYENQNEDTIQVQVPIGYVDFVIFTEQKTINGKDYAAISVTNTGNKSGLAHLFVSEKEDSVVLHNQQIELAAGEGEYFLIELINPELMSIYTRIQTESQEMNTYNNSDMFTVFRGYDESIGMSVSGSVASFGNENDEILIELIPEGETEAKHQTLVQGNNTKYCLENVVDGTYCLRVSQVDHTTREYSITVDADNINQDIMIHLKGDINGDGKVNTADVGRANAHAKKTNLLDGYIFACADVNGDGKVNTADVGRMNAHAKKTNLLW